eukprot:XP_001699627.1 predicted protein [Chlamydomonas reinhardtii]
MSIPADLVQQEGAPPAALLTLSRELQLQGRALGQSSEDAQELRQLFPAATEVVALSWNVSVVIFAYLTASLHEAGSSGAADNRSTNSSSGGVGTKAMDLVCSSQRLAVLRERLTARWGVRVGVACLCLGDVGNGSSSGAPSPSPRTAPVPRMPTPSAAAAAAAPSRRRLASTDVHSVRSEGGMGLAQAQARRWDAETLAVALPPSLPPPPAYGIYGAECPVYPATAVPVGGPAGSPEALSTPAVGGGSLTNVAAAASQPPPLLVEHSFTLTVQVQTTADADSGASTGNSTALKNGSGATSNEEGAGGGRRSSARLLQQNSAAGEGNTSSAATPVAGLHNSSSSSSSTMAGEVYDAVIEWKQEQAQQLAAGGGGLDGGGTVTAVCAAPKQSISVSTQASGPSGGILSPAGGPSLVPGDQVPQPQGSPQGAAGGGGGPAVATVAAAVAVGSAVAIGIAGVAAVVVRRRRRRRVQQLQMDAELAEDTAKALSNPSFVLIHDSVFPVRRARGLSVSTHGGGGGRGGGGAGSPPLSALAVALAASAAARRGGSRTGSGAAFARVSGRVSASGASGGGVSAAASVTGGGRYGCGSPGLGGITAISSSVESSPAPLALSVAARGIGTGTGAGSVTSRRRPYTRRTALDGGAAGPDGVHSAYGPPGSTTDHACAAHDDEPPYQRQRRVIRRALSLYGGRVGGSNDGRDAGVASGASSSTPTRTPGAGGEISPAQVQQWGTATVTQVEALAAPGTHTCAL